MQKLIVAKVFGKDISTDVIYPGRYMATGLPTETPQYAFADDEDFNKYLCTPWNERDGAEFDNFAIVAGENFGCGSSREQAVSTLSGNNLTVIAKSFARIFHQNAINLGLNMITCPDIEANPGENLEVTRKEVRNISTGKCYNNILLPDAAQEILDAGGLIPHVRSRLINNQL
jgi:3-isopropylmalate/(R)-2-methylmalate dehydratase small subunit